MNNIVSFKDLFDLSVVLMQSKWLDTVCRSNCQQVQCSLLFKQIMDGIYLPVFQYILAVDSVQQFVQTSSAKYVMLNCP